MTIMHQTTVKQLICAVALAFGGAGWVGAQEVAIGTITFQAGDTRLERNGTVAPIVKGQTLNVGDRLLTGVDGHVHARMVDNAFISVRPSARLHIKSYVYAPQEPSANRVGLMLESGVSRTISGKAGEAARENYRFNTPVAAIGLRGTDYVVQALPDMTRVSVSKGAITMSAFGPGCLASTLSPCTGPLVRELSAGSPHAYMEVRVQGGLPVIVLPGNSNEAPNKVVPPRPEELRVLAERPLTTALASEILNSRPATAPSESLAPPPVTASVPPAPAPPAPLPTSVKPPAPEIVWGRWSSVALQDVPTVASQANDDREITFVNSLFGLLRPVKSSSFPTSGAISMNLKQSNVYLQTAQPSTARTLAPVDLAKASLLLDFNNRQFATQLSAIAKGATHELTAQGSIHPQGFLLVDPARSNMNLAGALSNNANEAGYLFDAIVAPHQSLIGATRWGR